MTTQFNPYQIREILSMFVDVYYDEMEHLTEDLRPEERTKNTLLIIQSIKTTPFQNMENQDEFDDWFKHQMKAYPDDFAPFVMRGYEFFLFHFYAFYGHTSLNQFRDILARVMADTHMPRTFVEFTKPNQKYADWGDIFPTRPWAMFILVLRNTYINMGDPEPQLPNPTDQRDQK